MEIGIIGLEASGKSTLFDLLIERHGQESQRRRGVASVGIARVADPRLDQLIAMFNPRKAAPATVRYIDVPGIADEHQNGSSLNIPELRAMDALMVVLRGFENATVPHPLGSVDPARDLVRIEEELMLQDHLVVERRLERLERDLARKRVPELEAERAVLERCLEALEAETPLRDVEFNEEELKRIRGFTFLSMKPLLAVVNLGEEDIASDPFVAPCWQRWSDRPWVSFTQVCATLEGELAQLDGDEVRAFMDDLGLEDRALDRVISESYRLLGLISFFTVGEDECRAWTIHDGTPAAAAAGVIHSDLERGFIRAEVVAYDELLGAGSLVACRERGTLRLEGKTYPVRDGEVVHFRFNV